MRFYFILVFLILSFLSSAQKHDNIWVMGYEGGNQSPDNDYFGISVLDFSSGELEISDNQTIEMNISDANTTFSNNNGELLYYCNGIYIEDASFQTMLNGEGLNEWEDHGLNLPQGVLALPFPGNEDKSVLLNAEKGYIPGWSLEVVGLYYSIINMNGNNGLGEVVLKREPLIIDTLEYGKLTATRHANGRDWWVLINESHTNRFYKILLDPTGISVHDNQTVGMPTEQGLGQAVFSPDGTMYVMYNSVSVELGQFIEVYDFDRCTGLLSNHRRMHLEETAYSGGVAISPNSRYLYVSSYEYIYQFDLWASDIESTKITVAVYDGYQSPFGSKFYLAQLAPDGKIYLNCPNGENVLHVIHNPDEQGLACNVEQHGIQLPTYNGISLPNYPNYRLGALGGSPCDSLITSTLEAEVETSQMKLRPNPVSSTLTITFDYKGVEKIRLSSILGEQVLEAKVSNSSQELEIDVSHLPAGVYFCTLFTKKNTQIMSEKVMVVH
jgi:hypothetical protein